jgi:hypothetical protein
MSIEELDIPEPGSVATFGKKRDKNITAIWTLLIVAFLLVLGTEIWSSQQTVFVKTENGSALLTTVTSDFTANSANAKNVYQQQVTGTWAVKDFVNVIGLQNANIIDNQVAMARMQNSTNILLKGLTLLLGLAIAVLARIGFLFYSKREI